MLRRIAAPLHPLRSILATFLCAILLAGASREAAGAETRRPAYVEGEILVSFRPGARPEDVQAILRDLDAKPQRRFRRTRAERHTIAKPVADAVARYRNHPAVQFIEPNYILHADIVPNDTSFPIQWSLRNTGQQGGTVGSDIDAVAAWDQTTGSSQVLVAIIDSGMDLDHPDLAGNVFSYPGEIPDNGLDDDGNGFADDVHGFDFANFDADPTDDNGHGTHVAGTIGAIGNNGIGVAGVAWRVLLLPLKFLDGSGLGSTSAAIEAIDYAVEAGATVINASWSGDENSAALMAAISGADAAGVLFVTAAGNSSINNDEVPTYPGSFPLPNIIVVGSSARSDERSGFSNYGPTSVDLFAPGTQILSTIPNGGYAVASGTSMAAPHVVGAIALLKSRFPAMSAATMKSVTLAATDRIPALAGLSATGGRLNAVRMLQGVDSIAPAPVGDVALALASSDRVGVRWTATGDDGAQGTATRYDLRVATTPIDASSFAAATPVAGVAAPRVSGTREDAAVRGLTPLTDYYLAVVAIDEFGNPSALSNVLSFRTTAPPVATILPPALDQTLRTGQRAPLPLEIANDGGGILDFTVRPLGAAGGAAPSWISVLPASGSAAAGARSGLTVNLSAAGLRGGEYAALVRFATNDPARRDIDVPVALHVISAPNIEAFPDPVTFGPVAVGASEFQGLLVTNSGFADLHVTRVSVSGADYTVDEAPFDLPPGQSWELYVSVTPSRSGTITGDVSIESDDPDEPTLVIAVGTNGIVPATISVSPPRERAAIHTGQTTTRQLTIANTGGSHLSWTLRARSASLLAFDSTGTQLPPVPFTAAASPGAQRTDLSDVRVTFDSRNGASSGAWSGFIGTLTSGGALFTLNTQPLTSQVLDQVDVYWVSDASGAFTPAERGALAAWVRRGGSLLIEGADVSALSGFDALLDSLEVPAGYVADLGITGPTTRLFPYEITRGVSRANLPSSTARLRIDGSSAATIIEDALGFPAMAATFVGRGRVLAVAGRLFADVSATFEDNRQIATQSLDWLGGAAWLSTAPAAGTTQPGKTTTVTLQFDGARLAGGDYRAAIVFQCNDPARSDFLVPIDLALTPAPDVETIQSSVDFGSVFVGGSRRDSVNVRNVGVLPLRVTSLQVDDPAVSVGLDDLVLAPGAVGTALLDFAPAAVGPLSTTLTLHTDDPDEPVITVAIAGSGAPAPDIEVAATSVDATLRTGDSLVRTIAVANRAGSDLQFTVHFEEEAPAAPPAGTAPVRAAAIARSWESGRAEAVERAGRMPIPLDPKSLASASVDTLPLVVADGGHDGGVTELLVFRASGRDGVLNVEMVMGTDILPNNFGGYVSLDLDQNRLTGRAPSFGSPRQDVGVEYEIGLFSIGFGYVDLFDAHTGNFQQSFPVEIEQRALRFSIPLSWLRNDDGRINVSGVVGNFVQATDLFPNRGHGTIGGLWIHPSPDHGTVLAGSQLPVTLTVDALALKSGSYRGAVIVESNDPDEPVLSIPASMTVIDGPVIVATAIRVDFGSVFVGRSSEEEFIVGNKGTAPLTVSSITCDDPDFTAEPAAFTVQAGQTHTVRLTFRPSADGQRLGTLRIAHDAPGGSLEFPVSGEALAAPALHVAPARVEATLSMGSQGASSIGIRNDGGSALHFGVEPLNGAASVALHEALIPNRDEEDPRSGFAAQGTGGPDLFGYRWADSNQPGGPVFDWQEISAIGTPVPIRLLDQNSGPLPIGFSFPFYDRVFTTFNVCTHGWISFTDTTTQFANQPLPTLGAPPNLLAVFWDDLNFGGTEHAFYYFDGTRLIVQFNSVPRRQRGGPFTFQAILYPSGAIVYQYLLMGPPTTSGSIGIQNRLKTDGLGVVFDDTYVHDRMAIRFSAAPSWLQVPERFGTLAPGESTDVAVQLDARSLFAGAYNGTLRVSSNDPDRVEAQVPVVLRATGIPRLVVSPEALRFDTLLVGEAEAETLRVTNDGTDRLEVTSITSGLPDYSADPLSLSLAPLQSATIAVRFQPVAGGDRSTALTLASNDGARPSLVIPITAAAVSPLRELLAEVSPPVIQRGSRGRHIRVRIPLPAALDAALVLLAGVRFQDVVPPDLAASRLRDLDGDGRPDLDLAFDRVAAERALTDGSQVPVLVTGESEGQTPFAARDTVRVTGKRVAAPGVVLEDEAPPLASALHPSAPNPFRAETSIRFDLALPGPATLRVYTASGRLVRTVVAASLPAGRFLAGWDGRDDRGASAPSGVYFARLVVDGPASFRAVRRVTLLK